MDFFETARQFLLGYLYSAAYGLGFLVVFLVAERFIPAERGQPARDYWFNLKYFIVASFINLLLTPLVAGVVMAPLQARYPQAFGWISEADVGSLVSYALLYYLVFDLCYYAFHRLQHTWPLLWREHLLHHSEVSLNATTTLRQHWLEEPLKVFFIVLPMALLFETSPRLSGAALIALQCWAVFIHANIRLPLGGFGLLVAGPQFHRVHHSCLPEHIDRNFAVFFPFIDRIFGTYVSPDVAGYPPTGLASGGRIDTLWAAHLAPFRAPPGGGG